MNTIEKGNAFEKIVYGILQRELVSNRLLLNPSACKIFRGKKYYSKARNKPIVIDVSIECYLPDETDQWSFLIAVECKDYKSPVQVGKIEEFICKLEQIGGKNVKGIFATSVNLQESAFNVAANYGIALIRIFNDTGFKWELKRSMLGYSINRTPEYYEVWDAFVNGNYTTEINRTIGMVGRCYSYSINHLIEYLIKNETDYSTDPTKYEEVVLKPIRKKLIVPYLSLETIEAKCNTIIQRFNYGNNEVPFDKILAYFERQEAVKITYWEDLGKDRRGNSILGRITFKPSVISISSQAHNDDRERLKFTIAHELGHLLLDHERYISSEYISGNEINPENDTFIIIDEIRRMEWQANRFASNLLLPQVAFQNHLFEILDERGIRDRRHGLIYVDHQSCNISQYYSIITSLKRIFKVSAAVIEIRLKELNYLHDERFKSVNFIDSQE